MEPPREQPAEEMKRLQRCIDDLVSILALPAIWTGSEPRHLIGTLIESLQPMLRLELVYARLSGLADEAPIELVRIGELRDLAAHVHEVHGVLERWLGNDLPMWPSQVRNPVGDGVMSIVPLRLGLYGEVGVIVAGAQRADFPTQTERLLLNVAANQAAIGLEGARRLGEQKRLVSEFEQRVAERTRELEAANEELEKEVAERRLAEERLQQEERELKRSEARKAAILDSALECIVTIDHEGRITEFNRAAERTFGRKRSDVVGRPLADAIIPPSLRHRHREGFARYIATGDARVLGKRVEMTALHADGSEFPVELAITRIPLDGPPAFTGCLRDVTERKHSEEELRRSEAFLAEAQRLSATGSFSWRVATDEINWSDELYRIFAFPHGTPVTIERIIDRVHPADVPLVADMIASARRTGGGFAFELRLQMQDQSVKYLHMVARRSGQRHGQLEYIGAIQDVTERRASEQELAEVRLALSHASRVMTLGVMTASIAHEVNQPLSGIVTNASTCLRMLAADSPNIDGARETARRTIRDATGHPT
jgi:PAS domain S-box-containing protein